MKKLILIPAAAGVLAFGGIVLANTGADDGQGTADGNSKAAELDKMIGFEKAKSIALESSDGNVTGIELSLDEGKQHYEVEVQDKDYEYDYDIEAFTGEVLEEDRENLDDDEKQEVGLENGTAAADLISAEKASEIALKETGGGTIVELGLDNEDGIQQYEVEIMNGNKEFELEIDAVEGKILKSEQDDNDEKDDDDDEQDDD